MKTKYFYRPIPYYQGTILKCHGIATEQNILWMMAKPGTVILDGYRGDRITAADHKIFTEI